MPEGMLHIRDVEGPKKTGSVETRLEAMEQQVFKCQGMVERGLNANHMMITEFTNKHMIDANDIGKHLSRLYDRIDQLQAQIYDLQNQNCDDGGYLAFFQKVVEPLEAGISRVEEDSAADARELFGLALTLVFSNLCHLAPQLYLWRVVEPAPDKSRRIL
ncbi:40S ribosomal protein S5-1 [Hordeum vulgare]|nr:40S ribosomal protein S5-1 [Hordeum vulgare]